MSISSNLKFRRQFLLAPKPVKELGGWLAKSLGTHGWLYAHPDLPLDHCAAHGRQVFLAGFVVDASHPERTTDQVLSEVLRQLDAGVNLGTMTYSLGGRWVMVLDDGRELIVLNDPCGMRRVFHYGANGALWCGSDPRILERFAGARQDPALLDEFARAGVFEDREYWWPAPLTGYLGVRRLVPNHCLRVPGGEVRRYWPASPLPRLSLDECVEQLAPALSNQVQTMVKREPLAMTLTAGLDTRTILAACKEDLVASAWFHSWMLPSLSEASPDIELPRRMLKPYGLALHLLPCGGTAEPEFAEVYESNSAFAHAYWRDIAQGLSRHYPQDRLSVKGNCSEAGRCYYYHHGYPKKSIDAEYIASRERGWSGSPAIVKTVAEWLDDARQAEQAHGFRVLDLLHWEQRLGGCQANSQAEWDIAQEVFCPFNNRMALTALLAGPEEKRLKDGVHLGLIQSRCPELLAVPINPKPLRKRISKWLKDAVRSAE